MTRRRIPPAPARRVVLAALGLAAIAPYGPGLRAQAVGLEARLQSTLDSVHRVGTFPGATVGIALPDGRRMALAVGFADTARRVALRPTDRMAQGSVGKTYVAAVALQLVGEGRLALDAPIARHLGDESWFDSLPNARAITVRQLMQHTSGLVRYEMNPRFLADLVANPDRAYTPLEEVRYLFGSEPPFAAGAGWDYSDTNYIVLGMIIERITGRRLNDEIRRRLIEPLGLANTVANESPDVPGLVNGYAGTPNPFGRFDATLVDGRFALNPQFEWAGGGWSSTAEDLAIWASLLYQGRAFDISLLPQMLDGVEAPMLGPGTRYGLGVILRDTPLGATWGHSGFFPGYVTEMRWFPERRIAIAVQVNSSGRQRPGPAAILAALTRVLVALDRP